MKHGPIALIDEQMPVVVIATKKGHYEKVVSNIQEIKSRKGKIIGIVTKGDKNVKELADHVIEVPETLECLTPLLTTIPLTITVLSHCRHVWQKCRSTEKFGKICYCRVSKTPVKMNILNVVLLNHQF
jgi:fructoselysine-6-P-deglycase FrlB-like protein